MTDQPPILLFSYGTLRQPEVQLANFGRLLDGSTDAMPSYRASRIEITDPAVLATSGERFHPIGLRTDPRNRPQPGRPAQVLDFMLDRIAACDFYILRPDNETTLEQDAKRIAWAAGDVIENRPALSRWHPAWQDAFERHMQNKD